MSMADFFAAQQEAKKAFFMENLKQGFYDDREALEDMHLHAGTTPFDKIENISYTDAWENPFTPGMQALSDFLAYELFSTTLMKVQNTYERTGVMLPIADIDSFKSLSNHLVTIFSTADKENDEIVYLRTTGRSGEKFYEYLGNILGARSEAAKQEASRYQAWEPSCEDEEGLAPKDTVRLYFVESVIADAWRELKGLHGVDNDFAGMYRWKSAVAQ